MCEKIDGFRKFLKNENFGHFPLKNTKNLWKFHKRRVRMHPPIWTTCTTFFEHQNHRFKRISLGWDWPRIVAYGYMGIQLFEYDSYYEKAVWNFFTSFYQLHFSLSLLPAPVSKLLIICKSISLLFCSSWWTNMIYCDTLSAIYIPILRSQSF